MHWRMSAAVATACALGALSNPALGRSLDGKRADAAHQRYAGLSVPGSKAILADPPIVPKGEAMPITPQVVFAHQTEKVETDCFSPELRGLLAELGKHFGTTPVVTSGRRHARRRNASSLHHSCQAADVQVPGVSSSKVFEVAKRLPGRGGVGIYCHTQSVHIDTGTPREWGCRRRFRISRM